MPIIVVCPVCSTRLSAPDNAGGKHVRCPKAGCGTIVPVPVLIPAEVVESPQPRPVRPHDEDDEDDRRVSWRAAGVSRLFDVR